MPIELASHWASVLAATLMALFLLAVPSCAVMHVPESVLAPVEDSAISSEVMGRFSEDRRVDATAIGVETLGGTVMLSGFARNWTERATAESVAWRVSGVKSVVNKIAVRP